MKVHLMPRCKRRLETGLFYTKRERSSSGTGYKYWIGHMEKDQDTGEERCHRVVISEDFYYQFAQEAKRNRARV